MGQSMDIDWATAFRNKPNSYCTKVCVRLAHALKSREMVLLKMVSCI